MICAAIHNPEGDALASWDGMTEEEVTAMLAEWGVKFTIIEQADYERRVSESQARQAEEFRKRMGG